MSTTIDQQVVEMRFDNKQFESATATSMSTIDKLKQKLNFTGASKGLENINDAAKKVNLNGIGSAVEAVRVKFSALEVIGVTALANITNSAVNAGKRMISALTIDPVKTGFQEYETQINAIQTILANTQSKGSTLQDVNAALDELNKYADMTIYNFTEMTRNIGTFTAAGVDLDKSVTSIKGIANLAAISGSNAQQASTAMYQLSQALAAGRVSLMDWNSVVNAGMGGEVFQTALKRTATQMGYNVDALIAKYGSFRESLTEGQWLTAEVLTETLTQLSGAYSEADLIAQGYSKEQAQQIAQLAQTAVDAATKVKTFTQLWDTLKEAAQSGWTQTWEIIIGDFEEAKELLTGISDFVGNIINESSNRRNELLEGALGNSASKWSDLTEKINACGISTEQFESRLREVAIASGMTGEEFDAIISKNGSLAKAFEAGVLPIRLIIDTIKSFAKNLDTATKPVKVATDQLEYFNKVVGQVVRGDFGNGEERIKKLTAAGYDNVAVQKLVNHVWERNGKTWSDVSLTSEELTQVIGALSTSELENIGYTKEQAEALKQLAAEAEKTGTPINELIENLNKPSGRELLIDSFRNVLGSLYKAITAVSKAWSEIFPPMTSQQLYGIIEAVHTFTEGLVLTDDSAAKITRTFKGLFAIIDIITTVVGGGLKIALKTVMTLLGMADVPILDVTAAIGDAIVAVRDWIDAHNIFVKGAELIAPYLATAVDAVRNWINALKDSENLPRDIAQGIINGFGNAVTFVRDVINNLISYVTSGFSKLPDDMTSGFVGGLQNGIQVVVQTIVELGRMILQKIKDVLGIHSPSTEFFAIGQNIIQGLMNGVSAGLGGLWDFLKGVGQKIIEVFNGLDFGTIFAVGISSAMILTFYKVGKALSALVSPLEGIGDVLESASGVLDAFSGTLKSFSLKVKAEALKTIATAILMLAAAVAILSLLDVTKVWSSVGAIVALMTALTVMSVALDRVGTSLKVVDVAKMSGSLISIAAALLILSGAMKIMSTISWEGIGKAVTGIAAFGVFVAALALTSKYSKGVDEAGAMLNKLAFALLLLAVAAKIISGMEWSELAKAGAGLGGLSAIVAGLIAATRLAGTEIDKVGSTILKISAAMTLLVVAAKIISGMEWSELGKAGVGLVGLSAIVTGLIAATRLAGTEIDKVGPTILKISVALSLLAITARIISGMEWSEMGKAAIGLAGLSAIVAGLIAATKLAGEKQMADVTKNLLAMAVAIGILGGISVILGLVNIPQLAKGVVAVGILGAIVSMMIIATRGAEDVKGTIVAMSIAIGVMAASLAVLSFIDPTKLTGASAALGVVMGMFAVIIKSTENVGKAMGVLITMTAAIGVMAAALYLLAGMPIEKTIGSAASLSALMLSLSASMKIISNSGSVSASALVSIGTMTLVMGALSGILYLLDTFDVEAKLGTVLALSTLLLALSAACTILSKVGSVAPTALAAVGVLTLAVAAIGAILGVLDHMNVQPSIETASAISILLLALSAACVILSGVGMAGAAAIKGAAILDGVILIIGGLMAGIGALVAYFPQLEQFLDKGIVLLEKIGYGLGSFVGNIVGGLLSGITSGLVDIADDLSAFMEHLQPFLDGASKIDPKVVDSVGSLAKVILILTAANMLDGINNFFSFITGGRSLAEFANELIPFGEAMAKFGETIKGRIDPESMEAATNAGLMLAELNKSLPKEGGLLQDIFGSQDLEAFSTSLSAFGEAIVAFSQTIAPNGQSLINIDAVQAAANAGTLIADLNSKLPRSGGVLQDFLGSQDLGAFSEGMKKFGEAIVSFSKTIAPNGQSIINASAVEGAANAGLLIADLNKKLPRSGGALQDFLGSQDLGTFGTQLEAFGKSIVSFSNTVAPGGVSAISAEAITAAGNAALTMAELQNKLPPQGGFLSMFTGSKSIQVFGEELVSFGKNFKDYSDYMKDVDAGVVTNTANAAQSLVELQNKLPENKIFKDETWLNEFGSQISEFGRHFANYYDSVSRINTFKLSSVVTEVGRLVDLANDMNSLNTSGMSYFGAALTSMGNAGIDGFISAFENASSRVTETANKFVSGFVSAAEDKLSKVVEVFRTTIEKSLTLIKSRQKEFRSAGETIMVRFIDGVKSKSNLTMTAFVKIVNDSLIKVRNEYSKWKEAGSYLVSGFAQGITSNTWKAVAQATAMAKSATKAAEEELEIHSPSRVFARIGGYTVDGFAEGIRNKIGNIRSISADMSSALVDSFKVTLGINGTSLVMRDEVGRPIIQGIAQGITEDMSAEEAAAQKAQNIANAFKAAFDQIDLDLTTSNLEYQLWGSIHESTATESEKSAAELQQLLNQMNGQAKRVELANNEYKITLETFGETSEEAQEAHNKLLQEQINLADLVNQLNTLKQESVESNKSKLETYTSEVRKAEEALQGFGYSLEEIQKAVANRLGYDPSASTMYEPIDVEQVISDAMNGIELSFTKGLDKTANQLIAQSTGVGNSMATGFGEGIQNGTPGAVNATENMSGLSVETLKSKKKDWLDGGTTLVNGFIQGIKDNIQRAADTAAQMAKTAYEAAMSALNIPENSALGQLGDTLAGLYNTIDKNMEVRPVIRPVFDMDEVENGLREINTAISKDKAVSVGASINAASVDRNKGTTSDQSTVTSSIQFTQNNYSPKALSRVEIYRQTRNQLSTVERMVKK